MNFRKSFPNRRERTIEPVFEVHNLMNVATVQSRNTRARPGIRPGRQHLARPHAEVRREREVLTMGTNRRMRRSAALPVLLVVAAVATAHGDARLVDAARHRDQRAVRALLNQKVDVNGRSSDGTTALVWAAHWNDLETADLLLRAGADANVANDLRVTPLSLACTNGSAALVDRLLKAGAHANTAIATGETPLMTCAGAGSADAVRMLIGAGADVNAKEPTQNQTALMWAAAERHPEVVKVLVEHRADLQSRTKKGFTALHFAAREGDVESARVLLDAGVDVNVRSQPDTPVVRTQPGAEAGYRGGGARGGRDSGPSYEATVSAGSTPLLVATVRAQVPLALFLLEKGADPNAGDAGFTPLHWAAGTWESGEANPVFGFSDAMSGIPDRQAKLQLVKSLLAHGANVNAPMTQRPPAFAGRLQRHGRRDAVPARRCDSRYRNHAAPARGWRRSVADHQEQRDCIDGRGRDESNARGKRGHRGPGARSREASPRAWSGRESSRGQRRERPLRPLVPRLEQASSTDDRQRSERERPQQGGHHAVARGIGNGRSPRRRVVQSTTRRRSS